MRKIIIVSLLALAGCAPAAGVGGGIAAATIGPAVASSIGVSTTTLSEIATAACAAQAAANAASSIAKAQGSTSWASRFSDVSKLAGVGCAW